MIQTKNLDDLLDKKSARELFFKYQKEIGLTDDFKVRDIHRHLVLSPNTYAIFYEIIDDNDIRKIRVNASREETRVRAYKVMNLLENKFSGPTFFIPKVYFYDEDYNLLAYENIDGGLLIDQLNAEDLEGKIKLVGKWMRKLHLIANINLELPEHKVFFNFEALAKFYPELAHKGPDILRGIEGKISKDYQPKLIHGDYQPNNIVIALEKIFVFDFNDSRIDDPAWDLAKFLTQLKVMLFRFSDVELHQNLEKIFLESYDLEFNKENFQIYSKIYYLQILCSLSASLADYPEAKKTLPKIHQYFQNA